ncbi:MAG: SpoIIE family protein phosphatase [Cyclobacteriaceae bacterium]
MSIYSKLTSLCLFLVISSLATLFFVMNGQVEKAFKSELLASIKNQSEENIANIERFMFSRLNDVRMAAKNPYFQFAELEKEETIKRLQELEGLSELYYSFSFFNMDKVRLADSKRLSLDKKHSGQSYWTEIDNGAEYVMNISKSESIDRVVMNFASVVKNADNEKIGIIVGRILVDELYEILGNITLGKEGNDRTLNINLFNQEGLLLYSNTNTDQVLNDKYRYFEIVKDVKNTKVELLETSDRLFFVAKERGYQNYLGNNLTLSVDISKDLAFQPLIKIQKTLLWVVVPILLAAILLSLIAANVFVKPIIMIGNAAKELAKGNLDIQLNIKSKDELGELARQIEYASSMLHKRMEEQKNLNQELGDKNEKIELQKSELEHVNTQIEDSIKYAERIQKSILPNLELISKVTKDAFILNKPKDVVSGDFYWFERIRQGRNEYLIIACADCTGHGVPGAIMSIMGSNQLTNIIYYQNSIDPMKILARLDKQIKLELQRDAKEGYRDGMEMGLVVINLDDLTAEFAGAGIQLHLLRKGELTSFKGPRAMIGGMDGDEKTVASTIGKEEIQLEDGDKLYMFSDGFQDQFGGDNDKRFMAKNLKTLIAKTSVLPMEKQGEEIENELLSWQGSTPQTDDVLVMGIEI